MKKKFLKIFLIAFMLFAGINCAKAATMNLGDKFYIEPMDGKSSSGMFNHISTPDISHDGRYLSIVRYQGKKEGSNQNLVVYCLDPNLNAKLKNGHTVDRILGDRSSSLRVQAYDVGLLSIMKNGYNDTNKSVNGLYEADSYMATSLAIRAWNLGLYQFSAGQVDSVSHGLTNSIINQGISWAKWHYQQVNSITENKFHCDDTSVESVEKCLQNSAKNQYGFFKAGDVFTSSGVGTQILEAAQSLFYGAMDAAAERVQNNGEEASLKMDLSTRKDGEDKEYVVMKFTIKNLEEEGYVNNVKFNCPTCSANGMQLTASEYGNGAEWRTYTSNIDISDSVDLSGVIYVRFTITKTDSDACNGSVPFTVSYDYYDPNEPDYFGVMLKAGQNEQRFLTYVTTDGAIAGGQTPSEGGNSGGNENKPVTYEDDGVLTCKSEKCDTSISTPICSYNEEDAKSQIYAPDKIKACILENVDDAGNSYQLSRNNGGIDNDYCSIFCKEDYANIQFTPIVENVKCGRYFELTAKVEGKKDCYTSGGREDNGYAIDHDKFLEDIREVQEDMIWAHENLIIYTNYLKLNFNDFIYTCDDELGSESCCSASYYQLYVSGHTPTPGNQDPVTGKVEVQWRDLNNVYYPNVESIARQGFRCVREQTRIVDGEEVSYCPENATCHDGADEQTIRDYIQGRIDALKQDLDPENGYYVWRLKQILRNYNGCTTAWTNDFPFEQVIKFAYSDGANTFDIIGEENAKLEATGTASETSTIEVCTGSTDDKYNCQSGRYEISSDGGNDEVNYSSNYSSVFKDTGLTLCSNDVSKGCYNQDFKISQAKFVKKSVEKKQDYITPTLFSQDEYHGKVTTNLNGDEYVKVEVLPNKLPVSQNTVGGGWTRFVIEDLGEFYNNGEAGRLIDFEGDREANSVANALGKNSSSTFNGKFNCMYESPCRPPECPNCIPECIGEYCEWVECPECEPKCVNCIFNQGELQLNFKTISPNNFNSAGRQLGYNWNINTTNGELSLITNKARLTIEEIEKINDAVYDGQSDRDTSGNNLAFSVRMTSDMTNYILNYNDEINSQNIGGYANDSLTCYDYDGYKNIVCYSDFLDDLIDEFDSEGLVTVKNRTEKGYRQSNPNSNGYWEFWDGYVQSDSVIGGPAWK